MRLFRCSNWRKCRKILELGWECQHITPHGKRPTCEPTTPGRGSETCADTYCSSILKNITR